jgi:hypothetical protein
LANLVPKNDLHLAQLNAWQNETDIDFWTSIKGVNRSVHVLLSPTAYKIYKSKFESINLDYKIDQHNIQE